MLDNFLYFMTNQSPQISLNEDLRHSNQPKEYLKSFQNKILLNMIFKF